MKAGMLLRNPISRFIQLLIFLLNVKDNHGVQERYNIYGENYINNTGLMILKK